MSIPLKTAIKRLLRCFIANALAGGTAGVAYLLTHQPEFGILALFGGPLINAIGKYIREKYKADIVI